MNLEQKLADQRYAKVYKLVEDLAEKYKLSWMTHYLCRIKFDGIIPLDRNYYLRFYAQKKPNN